MTPSRVLAGTATTAILLSLAACGGGPVVVAQADGVAIAPADDGPTARGGDGGDGGQGGDGGNARVGPAPDPDLSPGTGVDAYKAEDPFLAMMAKPTDLPPRTIVAQGLLFYPRKLVVRPGARVTFDNRDVATHRVQTDEYVRQPARFMSKDARPGHKVRFTVPRKQGVYRVYCTYHMSMTMTVVVRKA